LGTGVVAGLIVLALVGVVFLLVDLFIPSRADDAVEPERAEARSA
jgi:hypothetical protein